MVLRKLKTLFLLLICAGILSNVTAVDPSADLTKFGKFMSKVSMNAEGNQPLKDFSNSTEEEVESGKDDMGMEVFSMVFFLQVSMMLFLFTQNYSSQLFSFIHRPPEASV